MTWIYWTRRVDAFIYIKPVAKRSDDYLSSVAGRHHRKIAFETIYVRTKRLAARHTKSGREINATPSPTNYTRSSNKWFYWYDHNHYERILFDVRLALCWFVVWEFCAACGILDSRTHKYIYINIYENMNNNKNTTSGSAYPSWVDTRWSRARDVDPIVCIYALRKCLSAQVRYGCDSDSTNAKTNVQINIQRACGFYGLNVCFFNLIVYYIVRPIYKSWLTTKLISLSFLFYFRRPSNPTQIALWKSTYFIARLIISKRDTSANQSQTHSIEKTHSLSSRSPNK